METACTHPDLDQAVQDYLLAMLMADTHALQSTSSQPETKRRKEGISSRRKFIPSASAA